MNRRNLLGSLFFGVLALCGLKRAEATPVADTAMPACPTALMYGHEDSLPPVVVACLEHDLPYFGMYSFEGNYMVDKILNGGWDLQSAKDRADLRQCWADLKATDPEVADEGVREAVWAWYKARHDILEASHWYQVFVRGIGYSSWWALA